MTLIKLLIKGRHATWQTWPTYIAFFILILILIEYFIFNIDIFAEINFLSLLGVSVSGLSFSLALLVTMVTIFNSDDMNIFYKWSKDHDDDRFVFFETFAPYAWIAILFSLSGLVSLTLGVLNLKILTKLYYLTFLLKSIDIVVLGLAIWSLMDLMIDTIINRINKIINKNEHN